MQTLETMRRRIESAEDLHAVVRVMKALAAVSIRQYEKAVESLTAYEGAIEMGLQVVLRNRSQEVATEEPGSSARWGAIVFGSDQGMCGSFNEQVAEFALSQLRTLAGRHPPTLLVVGTRIVGRLEEAGYTITQQFAVPSSTAGIASVVHELLLEVERRRFQEGVDRFLLIHHRPYAGGGSRPFRLQLLPVDAAWLARLAAKDWPSRSLPTFTMDWRRLFSALIRQHLYLSLYRAFAASLASENASRLASMQTAEKNIEEHLATLTVHYHQQRQQSITEELLDIVAGFETLTGGEE